MPDDLMNPDAIAGHNAPDYAQEANDRMSRDYAAMCDSVTDLLAEARTQPETIDDEASALTMGAVIKRLRDLDARLEGVRIKEKEPFLRGGNAVDQFFNAQRDKLARRNRTSRPGAIDILNARVADFQERKLREEQERRRQEAERQAREAAEARRKQEETARLAREAEAAAARARTEQSRAARAEEARVAAEAASAAVVNSQIADSAAEAAHIDSLAKPADIARTRGGEGVTLSMSTEPYAIIEDVSLLDLTVLRPFISVDAWEKALRAWARTTGYNTQMTGAKIGRRAKSVVR